MLTFSILLSVLPSVLETCSIKKKKLKPISWHDAGKKWYPTYPGRFPIVLHLRDFYNPHVDDDSEKPIEFLYCDARPLLETGLLPKVSLSLELGNLFQMHTRASTVDVWEYF